MALRKIHSFHNDPALGEESRSAVVYRDSEYQEYRVKFYRNGVYQVNADYHDDDKASALQTAENFVQKGI